jgi:hypothetical protein
MINCFKISFSALEKANNSVKTATHITDKKITVDIRHKGFSILVCIKNIIQDVTRVIMTAGSTNDFMYSA